MYSYCTCTVVTVYVLVENEHTVYRYYVPVRTYVLEYQYILYLYCKVIPYLYSVLYMQIYSITGTSTVSNTGIRTFYTRTATVLVEYKSLLVV